MIETLAKKESGFVPGRYLVEMPEARIDDLNLEAIVTRVANGAAVPVSLLYRDKDSQLKFITIKDGSLEQGSFNEFKALDSTSHLVCCLYTQDCQGGDFDQFSRENLKGQAIACVNEFPSENADYQWRARARCTGKVGTSEYDLAVSKAKSIPLIYFLNKTQASMKGILCIDTDKQNRAFKDAGRILQAELDRKQDIKRLEGKIKRKKMESLVEVVQTAAEQIFSHPELRFTREEKKILYTYMRAEIVELCKKAIKMDRDLAQMRRSVLTELNRGLKEKLNQMYFSEDAPFVQDAQQGYTMDLVQGKYFSRSRSDSLRSSLIEEIQIFIKQPYKDGVVDLVALLNSEEFKDRVLIKIKGMKKIADKVAFNAFKEALKKPDHLNLFIKTYLPFDSTDNPVLVSSEPKQISTHWIKNVLPGKSSQFSVRMIDSNKKYPGSYMEKKKQLAIKASLQIEIPTDKPQLSPTNLFDLDFYHKQLDVLASSQMAS